MNAAPSGRPDGSFTRGLWQGVELLAMALLLIACTPSIDGERAQAAGVTATCESTVSLEVATVDRRGTPVPGVTVTLSVEGTGDGATAESDRQGIVQFDAVAACASVGIWASRGGFELGFSQVVMPPAAHHTQRVTVRP